MDIPVPIPIRDIYAAKKRTQDCIHRTQLIKLGQDNSILLKPENLQPIGSFELRGAGNAMEEIGANNLSDGVYTASAGNMAQGVAWYAKKMKIPCNVIVPDHAPQTKLDAIENLGANYVKVSFEKIGRAHV